MTEHDAKLETIRKILNKAEHPSTPAPEAEALTLKAARLIAKYGIDAALLAERAPTTDTVEALRLDVAAPYALDKISLLAAVALPLRCKLVHSWVWQGDAKARYAIVYGFASDLRRVELLYTSLLVQSGQALAATEVPWHVTDAGTARVKAWRRAWLSGYSSIIGSRLREAEQAAAAEATAERAAAPAPTDAPLSRSVELVLADRSSQVDAFVASEHPDMTTARRRSLSGGRSARMAGARAGMNADLGGKRVTATGGSARALGQ